MQREESVSSSQNGSNNEAGQQDAPSYYSWLTNYLWSFWPLGQTATVPEANSVQLAPLENADGLHSGQSERSSSAASSNARILEQTIQLTYAQRRLQEAVETACKKYGEGEFKRVECLRALAEAMVSYCLDETPQTRCGLVLSFIEKLEAESEYDLSRLIKKLKIWQNNIELQLLPYRFEREIKQIFSLRKMRGSNNSKHLERSSVLSPITRLTRDTAFVPSPPVTSIYEAMLPRVKRVGVMYMFPWITNGIDDEQFIEKCKLCFANPEYAALSLLKKLDSVHNNIPQKFTLDNIHFQSLLTTLTMQICYAQVSLAWQYYTEKEEADEINAVLALLRHVKEHYFKENDSVDEQLAIWTDQLSMASERIDFLDRTILLKRGLFNTTFTGTQLENSELPRLMAREYSTLTLSARLALLLDVLARTDIMAKQTHLSAFIAAHYGPGVVAAMQDYRQSTQDANALKRAQSALRKVAQQWVPFITSADALRLTLWLQSPFIDLLGHYQSVLEPQTWQELFSAFSRFSKEEWAQPHIQAAYKIYADLMIKQSDLTTIKALWEGPINEIPHDIRFSPVEALVELWNTQNGLVQGRDEAKLDTKQGYFSPVYETHQILKALDECLRSSTKEKINPALQVRYAFMLGALPCCKDEETFIKVLSLFMRELTAFEHEAPHNKAVNRLLSAKSSEALLAQFKTHCQRLLEQCSQAGQRAMQEVSRYAEEMLSDETPQVAEFLIPDLYRTVKTLIDVADGRLRLNNLAVLFHGCREFFPAEVKLVAKAALQFTATVDDDTTKMIQSCLSRLVFFHRVEATWLQNVAASPSTTPLRSQVVKPKLGIHYVAQLLGCLMTEIREHQRSPLPLPTPTEGLPLAYLTLYQCAKTLRAVNDYYPLEELTLPLIERFRLRQHVEPMAQHKLVLAQLEEDENLKCAAHYGFYCSMLSIFSVDDASLVGFQQACQMTLRQFTVSTVNFGSVNHPYVDRVNVMMELTEIDLLHSAAKKALAMIASVAPAVATPVENLLSQLSRFCQDSLSSYRISAQHGFAVMALVSELFAHHTRLALGDEATMTALRSIYSNTGPLAAGVFYHELEEYNKATVKPMFGSLVAKEDFSVIDCASGASLGWDAFKDGLISAYLETQRETYGTENSEDVTNRRLQFV